MFKWFQRWRYTDDDNCWEYVRQFLIREAGVESHLLPKFGICPSDKKSMTKAYLNVKRSFVDSDPVDFSVACCLRGRLIDHVGIVYNDKVWHTGSKTGTQCLSIERFENLSPRTIYQLHETIHERDSNIK